MDTTELSQEEVAAVMRMRREKAERATAEAFRSKAIATAHDFDKWSAESGQGLTYSAFVNTFGYQEADGKAMYEAVDRINQAACPPKF